MKDKIGQLTTSRVCWVEMKKCWAMHGQLRRYIEVLGLNRRGTNSINLMGYNKLELILPNQSKKSIENQNNYESKPLTMLYQLASPL